MGMLGGMLIGSLIASYAVYALLHWAVFKRVTSDRLVSRLAAAIVGYPVSAVAYGFGTANGGEFQFGGFVIYLLSSIIVLAYALYTGNKERRDSGSDPTTA